MITKLITSIMKFSRGTVVTVAMVATSSQFGMALEEKTSISGIKVVNYPVSEVILASGLLGVP